MGEIVFDYTIHLNDHKFISYNSQVTTCGRDSIPGKTLEHSTQSTIRSGRPKELGEE